MAEGKDNIRNIDNTLASMLTPRISLDSLTNYALSVAEINEIIK
ncbi:hypothetical protein [Celerinatantimonas diazotrophica]|nr:hypothetical protein [Celerinatantimonas diazotrophica]